MGRKTINELTESERTVIAALARNGLHKGKAAREIHYAYNSIDYIIGRIRVKTRLNPMDFYDMIKLIDMVKVGNSDD